MRPFSRSPALRRRMRTFYSQHTLPACPPLHCFRPALPSTSAGHPPQWTLAAPAPWHPPVTSVPLPKKTFFLRVFRPCFCQKFLLYLSCRPLYKTYIFTNIYCHTITICMQENIARLGGASRGGGGVFSREPFFKGPRGLRNGFLWGSSACRNGRNDRTGGRGRVAGRRNGTGNRFFGGPGRRNGEETDSSVGRGPPQNDRKGLRMTERGGDGRRAERHAARWQEVKIT